MEKYALFTFGKNKGYSTEEEKKRSKKYEYCQLSHTHIFCTYFY
jgi:hypothetical protein